MDLPLWTVIKNFFRWENKSYDDQINQVLASTGEKIKPDEPLSYNVYEAERTMRGYIKQQKRIHQHFKHKIIYPGLWFGKKVLGRYLVKEIPNSIQFKNLRIFDKAFEKSCEDWCWYYREPKYHGVATAEADFKGCMNSGTISILRTLKEFVLTVAKNDTAYLEFMNMLMFNIAIEMNKHHPKEPMHVPYMSNSITDVGYFLALYDIEQKKLNLTQVRKRGVYKSEFDLKNGELNTKDLKTKD